MPLLWTQRFKANLAKLISGDIYKVAEVVRDLSLRERRKAPVAGGGADAGQGPGHPDLRADLRR